MTTTRPAFIETMKDGERLRLFHHALQQGDSLLIEELWNAPKAFLASIAQEATGKHVLILTGANAEEQRLYNDFSLFTQRPVVDFPAWESLPNEAVAPSPDIVGERYQVLADILKKNEPHIITTSVQACLQRLITPKEFSNLYLNLTIGDSWPFALLIEQLNEMGYSRRPVAADKGEFAVRGGIIDIFPVSSPDPFRIEFFGDDIESIRIYDPIGQKSVNTAKKVQITPAQEMELIGKAPQLSTLLDYLGPNTLVIFDDLLALEDRYTQLLSICGQSTTTFASIDALMEQLAPLQKIFFSQSPIDELSEIRLLDKMAGGYYAENAPIHKIGFEIFNRKFDAGRWHHPFIPIRNYLFPEYEEGKEVSGEEVFLGLGRLAAQNCTLHLLYNNESEEVGMQRRLLEASITLPAESTTHIGYLSSGFATHDSNQVLLPTAEITRRYKIRRQKLRSTYHTTPTEVYDLTPGDMIVHLNNGIGRYLGQEKRPDHNGIVNEYLLLEYADNARLYVPISQSHLISRYIGSKEDLPRMHALGSKIWKKTWDKTEQAIIGYAKDLLELYAKREIHGGFRYPTDSADILAFEDEFPFTETEDQLQAVAAIKQDMVSEKPMERLICGDVGYGKTEVAMRAAFKAVIDGGKQVAVLVPTTVLAMQHYENFVERMRNFPLTVGVVSRFNSAKQTRDTIEGVAKGSVDILVGTHRLISDDIKFKDLGLIIIDEEHRFGVRAKEHLKRIRTGVDCLTLSATPIPRTLYMSLIGARDMSLINTPPQDRLPIKTAIIEPNDVIIRNALLRELSRSGQAYFIHNRVETLPERAAHLKMLLPQARIAIVHGQMHADEIDSTFHAFKSGQVDILCATTIVESGIDIPNANTILIDRADHFGLADLYQLRGRVGRWNRRAYAYFLVRRLHLLPDLSRKRLDALAESSGYGGGMKLAMRDLEIRGAGDILGTEQSGHVAAVGFHFYCRMLKRTIKALQGEMPASLIETKMDFPYDARIPESYIDEWNLRREIYHRFGDAITWEEVETIWEEIRDRFGPPPQETIWLYHLHRIRIFAAKYGFTLVKIDKVSVTAERKAPGNDPKAKPLSKKAMLKKINTTPAELERVVIEALVSLG